MVQAPSPRSVQSVPAIAIVAFVLVGFAGGGTSSLTASSCPPTSAVIHAAATVAWPASTTLLVSEVVTGGTSASDEFVEIYNASDSTADLAGLELVYATSTGSTVTRKQAWTALPLAAHAHLLLANSAGAFVPGADALYSGGFSATGGSLVLRVVGGAIVDSLSWGDASSAMVEGTPGLAPPARSSLERLPGGGSGNAMDSNDNVADTWVNASPVPQSTASEPVPIVSPTPTATPTSIATSSPTLETTPPPTSSPTASPSAAPSPTATASPTPSPTILCTPAPTQSAPTTPIPSPSVIATRSPTLPATAMPTQTPSPILSPSPSPTPEVVPIASARTLGAGTRVAVRGIVTVAPGWILGDTTIAIQDDTAGIYVRLPQMSFDGIVPGRVVQVEGPLAAPYGNVEIRPPSTGVQLLEATSIPVPLALTLDQFGESTEGLLASVSGTIKRIEGSSATSLTLILEDSTGEGRVFAHGTLGLSRDDFSVGRRVTALGLVGDRLGLYRLWPRNRFDITLAEPQPSPTPHPTKTPRPTPTPRPSPTPRPTPTPTRTPTPTARSSNSPAEASIAEALRRQGQSVTIQGVATTRNGLLDADGDRVAVQDASGAILVRLPDGVTVQPGQRIRVSGEVGTYYNAPQLSATTAARTGDTTVQPLLIRTAPVAAALEWRLIVVTGTVESVHRDGDSWRAELKISGGGIPIVGLARSGIESTALVQGRTATITGIVKRAYPTASDQRFAVVPRSAADVKLGAAGSSGTDSDGDGTGDGRDSGSGSADGQDGSSSQASPGSSGSGIGVPGSGVIDGGLVPQIPLADLAAYVGRTVSAGGAIVQVDASRMSVDDGTSVGRVKFGDAALSVVRGAVVGDLLNVRGMVTPANDGGLEIVVEDPTAVEWVDRTPTAGSSIASPATTAAALSAYESPVGARPSLDGRLVALALLVAAAVGAGIAIVMSDPERRRRVMERLASASAGLKQRLATLRSS